MLAADFQSLPHRHREPISKRAIALAFVIAVHIALVALLLTLNSPAPHPAGEQRITAFNLAPVAALKPAIKPTPKKKTVPAKARHAPSHMLAPAAAVAQRSKSDASKPFTTELFEAVDISKLPNHSAELAAEAAAAGAAAAASTAAIVGTGPDGKPLYQAEWYTEPTHAELAYYLPKAISQDSWAMIACKTIEKFRVDDCREIGEYPSGSGLSRALRQAAWQFKVRPPRIGGEAQLGVWVRIRFDFSRDGEG